MPKMTVPQKIKDATKRLIDQDSSSVVEAILESSFWPRVLDTKVGYRRISDDTSGDLAVVFSDDGDSWVEVVSRIDPKESILTHRFRTPFFGGGESHHVRNALIILAIAIKLDNETAPQSHRRSIGDTPA